MALVKSHPSQHNPSALEDTPAAIPQDAPPAVLQDAPDHARKGRDFGNKAPSVSADTYIKLRFSDTPAMPETWFKLRMHSDGTMEFEPTSREHPVVLLMTRGDSTLRMYHFDDAGNFGAIGPQRLEGVLATLEVRKRRDSTPDNPQMFLAGTYVAENGRPERELRGNVVGAYCKEIMMDMSQAGYREWKARQPIVSAPPAAAAPKTVELVAGQELNFEI